MLINNLSLMFLIANNRVDGTHNTKKIQVYNIIQYMKCNRNANIN